nr:hypothetical protein [Neisseria meningitidis]
MQTYIITMDMENELSEAAASALNGRFFTCPQNYQAIWDQVSDYLSDKGFPHGIAQDVFEAVEYFTQNSIRKIGRPKTLTCSRRLYR